MTKDLLLEYTIIKDKLRELKEDLYTDLRFNEMDFSDGFFASKETKQRNKEIREELTKSINKTIFKIGKLDDRKKEIEKLFNL